MFFIFTKGPFGSLWGIRTEVARVHIPTMSKAKKNEETDRWQIRIDAVLLPAVDAKRVKKL
jgi:hypothetical protein